MRWVLKKGTINQIEWDINTTTAADYTVELNIDESSYKKWFENEYKKPGGDYSKDIPPAMSLKIHIIRILEERLTRELEERNQQDRQKMSVAQLIEVRA